MPTKLVSTASKLASLGQSKKERIAKIEEQLLQQQTTLLAKRKEELFKLFSDNSALTIDDKLLVGFLKFVRNPDNKNHPILHEFKEIANKTKIPSKPKSGNVKTD